jgi:aminoglycoside phosphotransferase (APT) family kinase protein
MTPIDRQAAFSGTKDVPDALRIDTDRLAAYLADHVPDLAPPLRVRQFRGGQSNPTYLVDTPSQRYVLRRKPPGKLLPSAHAVDREYRVLRALYVQGFTVARPLVYCDEPDIIGTPFFLMAFVEGRVFWEPHMPQSRPDERAAIYDAMNATIASLHGFDPAAIGLADFGRGDNYVGRQIERWSKQYRASQTEAIEDMEHLIAWLPQNLPPAAPIRLVHGDYRLDNIIIAAGGTDILAVIDWELATLGDPLADFTYHLMKWFMPTSETGAGVGTLVGHDLAGLGIPAAEDYAARYATRTGLDPRPRLAVYLAYNFFRLAAIFQGIVARAREGTATSDHAHAGASMVRPLAARGWAFAREAGA